MGVTREREKVISIAQESYTKSLLERYKMTNCNQVYTRGVGHELPLDQPQGKLLNKEDKLHSSPRHSGTWPGQRTTASPANRENLSLYV